MLSSEGVSGQPFGLGSLHLDPRTQRKREARREKCQRPCSGSTEVTFLRKKLPVLKIRDKEASKVPKRGPHPQKECIYFEEATPLLNEM